MVKMNVSNKIMIKMIDGMRNFTELYKYLCISGKCTVRMAVFAGALCGINICLKEYFSPFGS
jgi:hypothetical protein